MLSTSCTPMFQGCCKDLRDRGLGSPTGVQYQNRGYFLCIRAQLSVKISVMVIKSFNVGCPPLAPPLLIKSNMNEVKAKKLLEVFHLLPQNLVQMPIIGRDEPLNFFTIRCFCQLAIN